MLCKQKALLLSTWPGVLFSIILTRLWASIGVTRSYSSRPFLCALVYHYTRDSKDLETSCSIWFTSVLCVCRFQIRTEGIIWNCKRMQTEIHQKRVLRNLHLCKRLYTFFLSSIGLFVLLPKLSSLQFLSLSVVARGVWVWCGCRMWNVILLCPLARSWWGLVLATTGPVQWVTLCNA